MCDLEQVTSPLCASVGLSLSFLLCWVFVVAHGLSLVAASRGCSSVAVCWLLIAVVSPVAEHGL